MIEPSNRRSVQQRKRRLQSFPGVLNFRSRLIQRSEPYIDKNNREFYITFVLRPDQERQVSKQIEAYENAPDRSQVAIKLHDADFPLVIHKYVAHPEIMNSGVEVVSYLSDHPELVKDKIVTDMGTGSGIIGISAGLLGAKKVFMPEVDPRAVLNAQENIQCNNLSATCETFGSDLFAEYGNREYSDVQIFNHPFFAGTPEANREWTRMMLGDTDLLGRYMKQAPEYSKKNALYLFPWLTLAASDDYLDNDPGKRAPQFGYEVIDEIQRDPVGKGLQTAQVKIYVLRQSQQL